MNTSPASPNRDESSDHRHHPATATAGHPCASLLVATWMVEARDPYTGGHLWRVSQFAMILSARASLPEAELERSKGYAKFATENMAETASLIERRRGRTW